MRCCPAARRLGAARLKGESMDRMRHQHWTAILIAAGFALALASGAGANTINQNTSWTIDRAGTSTTYRVVAYGDSIFAGYRGSIFNVAKRAAPWSTASTSPTPWDTDVEVIRRTKSGAMADDIYNNKIVGERSYMQNDQHARRDVRDVRQRLPAGAQQLQRAERHLQLQRRRTTRWPTCTNYTGLGDERDQPVRHHGDAEDDRRTCTTPATTPTTG